MKTKFTLAIAILFTAIFTHAQYCVVPGAPYSSTEPGITNFKIGTINRTSAGTEGSTSVMVATGETATLIIGQTYSISLSHNDDPISFSGIFTGYRNNLRVWIDYNKNNVFDTLTETVLYVNLKNPNTTHTVNVTIPATVTPGPTGLRATAKMSSDGGHSWPNPCNVPVDMSGYHGEVENYTIVFANATGIENINTASINASLYPNPFSQSAVLSYDIKETVPVTVEVFNLLGEKVATLLNEEQNQGTHKVTVDKNKFTKGSSGIYFVRLTVGNLSHTEKMIITE